jgi:transposase
VSDSTRADYERVIAEQAVLIVSLRELIEVQAARIAVLEKAAGQDSSNSSKPPSSDGVGPRKKRAERRAEARAVGRRPGKQPGTPGTHLRRRDPDVTIVHAPVCCGGCGTSMDVAVVVGTEARQVIDLIPARVCVSEHVVERRRCACGHETAGVPAERSRIVPISNPLIRGRFTARVLEK